MVHRINLSRRWRIKRSVQPDEWIDVNQLLEWWPKTELVRQFNRPTGLDETTKITLVAKSLPEGCQCRFNDVAIGFAGAAELRSEITSRITAYNSISLLSGFQSDTPFRLSKPITVWLEISQAEYCRVSGNE